MTDQRRTVAKVLGDSLDHPDVEEVYRRASAIDPHISLATTYRTLSLFEDAGIVERHDFNNGRSRYEEAGESHHDHLINVRSGEVIEFFDQELEDLQDKLAARLGYRIVAHKLELYGVPLQEEAVAH